MVLSFFYLGGMWLFLLGMLCVYKTSAMVSLFKNVILCLITELCIGALIAKIYAIAGVPIDLFSMGIGYWAIGIVLWVVIARQHKIQCLKIYKADLYAFAILGIAFILIFFRVFTIHIKNVYVNSDPAIHFIMAMQVIKTKKISSMYFGELYNALFISLLSPFIEQVNFYKAFILADAVANFINLMMFYIVADFLAKSKTIKLLLPFLCILYFLGWPFFSFALGGFVYFGWGVTLYAYTIYLILILYKTDRFQEQILAMFLIALGCYSVLICYMLFVPILGIIVIYSLGKIKKRNKVVFSHKLKRAMIAGSIIGGGVILCVAYRGYFHGDVNYIVSALKQDGWIHKDLYRDFALFIPAYLYMLYKSLKEKENNLVVEITTIIIFVEVIAFTASLLNYISPYYYYKIYYLLWVMAWLIFIDAMEYFKEKDKAIMVIYIFTIVSPMVMTLSGLDAWLEKRGIVCNDEANRHYPGMFPILDRNEFSLSGDERQYEDKDALIEACTYINDYLSNERIPLITGKGSGSVEWWYIGITQNESVYVTNKQELEEALKENSQNCKYFMFHENTEIYRQNMQIFQIYDRIYSNGYYGIYKF